MDVLKIDPFKCKKDGICVANCPMRIIETDSSGLPRTVSGAEALCIDCGHCVAVCPVGAVDHRTMAAADCPPVVDGWTLDETKMLHLLRSRRSIRSYRKQRVEKDLIHRLIRMVSYAPSGHNRQPVCWTVFDDPDEISTLAGHVVGWMRWVDDHYKELSEQLHLAFVIKSWEAGTDRILRGAPNLLVAHGPKEDRTAPAACTIALAHMELAAPALGLGACWAGYLNGAAQTYQPLQEALGLPEGHLSQGAMMLGHPSVVYHRSPLRKEPRISWRG